MQFGSSVGTAVSYKVPSTGTHYVELWGGTRMGWEFHIRGPDGRRGGKRTMCGLRMRPYWNMTEINANLVYNMAMGDSWGSEFQIEGRDAWGSYYYGHPCAECSRRYLLTADG